MDVISQLLSGSTKSSPTPELLETLGTRAASRYLKEKVPLNEAIRALSQDHPNLENEHLKRIAEFANNSVFQRLHANEDDKNVHFDIANPGDVIRDLKDGGSPAHDGKTLNQGMDSKDKRSDIPSVGDGDYRRPPGDEMSPSTAQGFGNFESGLAELMARDQSSGAMGQGEPISKVASLSIDHARHANPIQDVHDTHVRLQAAREKTASVHEQFDMMLKQAKEEFYQAVKHEVLDPEGPTLQDIVQAVKIASPEDSVAWRALRPVAERLVKEGALRPQDLEKTAGARPRLVNPAHPVVQAFAGLWKAAEEKVRAREALRDIDAGLEQTTSFLRNCR